jgi:glycosyltransferase involved in cell wall biosynthesis
MHVSVVTTVYNEAGSVQRLLKTLAAQTRLPDEIVICDGGSQDDTVAQIAAWVERSDLEVKVLVEPGANISRGRNIAIAAARGPIIAATDAGVRLDPNWLANLVAPWEKAENDSLPVAVAGFFLPDVTGIFQSAMAATVLPLHEDINPDRFLPSSRSVAFTKEAWADAGGYPEWLDYCEDLIFDLAINKSRQNQSSAFVWSPNALVYFRPRTSLRSFWTQYYRYARGDGKADLFGKRHSIRYFIYFVLLPALIGHALWGNVARWLGWCGLVVGVLAYCWRPWRRLAKVGATLGGDEWLVAALWVPVIRAVGDLAKMAGYPVGKVWRVRHRHLLAPVGNQKPRQEK